MLMTKEFKRLIIVKFVKGDNRLLCWDGDDCSDVIY